MLLTRKNTKHTSEPNSFEGMMATYCEIVLPSKLTPPEENNYEKSTIVPWFAWWVYITHMHSHTHTHTPPSFSCFLLRFVGQLSGTSVGWRACSLDTGVTLVSKLAQTFGAWILIMRILPIGQCIYQIGWHTQGIQWLQKEERKGASTRCWWFTAAHWTVEWYLDQLQPWILSKRFDVIQADNEELTNALQKYKDYLVLSVKRPSPDSNLLGQALFRTMNSQVQRYREFIVLNKAWLKRSLSGLGLFTL